MIHLCHALDCNKRIPPRLLFCPQHWAKVSKLIRALVWRHYRPGQEVDKKPSPQYLVVQRMAILEVAVKEKLVSWQDLFCPICDRRHVDEGEFALRIHKTHRCAYCGQEWLVEPRAFGKATVPKKTRSAA